MQSIPEWCSKVSSKWLPFDSQRSTHADALVNEAHCAHTRKRKPRLEIKFFGSQAVSTPSTRFVFCSPVCYTSAMDEGRKRVLLIAAAILASRKLAQFDRVQMVPAGVSAIANAVRWAEEIMKEIDRCFPSR